jgi:cell shape-determining protein MreC
MDLITYNTKLKEIEKTYDDSKLELLIQYAKENNPYKIGDVITDHIGSIQIESFKVAKVFNGDASEMVYFGVELKKDGTPKKNGDKRNVFQSNII